MSFYNAHLCVNFPYFLHNALHDMSFYDLYMNYDWNKTDVLWPKPEL